MLTLFVSLSPAYGSREQLKCVTPVSLQTKEMSTFHCLLGQCTVVYTKYDLALSEQNEPKCIVNCLQLLCNFWSLTNRMFFFSLLNVEIRNACFLLLLRVQFGSRCFNSNNCSCLNRFQSNFERNIFSKTKTINNVYESYDMQKQKQKQNKKHKTNTFNEEIKQTSDEKLYG